MSNKIHMGAPTRSTDFDAIIDRELHPRPTTNLVTVQQRLLALRSELLPTQLAMLLDPAKRKSVCCTRRAGKTYYTRQQAAEFVLSKPWSDKKKAQPVVQYIAQTQKKALDLFWTPFKLLCERIGLDAHWNDSNLRCDMPNGVLVRAGGVDNKDELEKFLGDAYSLVLIDEAQSFGPKTEDLIISKLAMAMADYDGTIIMTGTPGQSKVGYFYDVSMGLRKEWSVQPRWTFMDNHYLDVPPSPTIRNEAWILANVGALESPRVRRECFGEWVTDASTLVYNYESSRNEWDGELPFGYDWQFLLGVDVGWRDPTAFVVGAYAKTHPWLFILDSSSSSHLLPSQIETRIAQLNGKYKFSRIVMDTGGSMARNNMEEWNRRSQFGIIPAEKQNKLDYIEHMNSEFHLGRIKVKKGLSVVKYWQTLPWEDADEEKQKKRHDQRLKEHSGFDNHECDAALYMFRESIHYRSKEIEPDPPAGTPQYWAKQQQRAKLNAYQAIGKKGFRYDRLKQ